MLQIICLSNVFRQVSHRMTSTCSLGRTCSLQQTQCYFSSEGRWSISFPYTLQNILQAAPIHWECLKTNFLPLTDGQVFNLITDVDALRCAAYPFVILGYRFELREISLNARLAVITIRLYWVLPSPRADSVSLLFVALSLDCRRWPPYISGILRRWPFVSSSRLTAVVTSSCLHWFIIWRWRRTSNLTFSKIPATTTIVVLVVLIIAQMRRVRILMTSTLTPFSVNCRPTWTLDTMTVFHFRTVTACLSVSQ